MSDIGIMDDFGLYAFWLSMVAAVGLVIAVVERRVLARYRLWILLVLAAFTGFFLTEWSPFTFAGDDYYMTGVIVSAGALLLLAGYSLGAIGVMAFGQLKRRNEQ